jgi:formate dehydrogenase major subunit
MPALALRPCDATPAMRTRTMKPTGHPGGDGGPRNGGYARLTQPLIRTDGRLRPAGWDEALDFAAAGLKSVVAGHGPRAVGMFSCSKTTNEMNFIAQKFMRTVIGSNNIDSCNRT